MHHVRKFPAALGAVVAVFVLAACGSSSNSDSSSTKDSGSSAKTENVTLLMNWFAQAEQGGYFQTQAAGIGKADGLNIDVKQGGPQIQTIPQVAAGKAEFGVAQADELMLARSNGVPVVQVFGGMDKYLQCLMYHPSSGIKDFPDISGNPVAVAPSGGFWSYLKQKYKLKNVKEINFTGSLAEFKRNKDLVQQCFITSEPYFASQQKIDHAELMVSKSGYNPYSQGLFTSEKMIKEHPETVRKVVAAAQKGWTQFLQNPAAAKALIMKVNNDTDPKAFDFAVNELRSGEYLGNPVGGMVAERWNTLEGQLKSTGVMTKDVDVSKVWTDQFVPKP